MRDFVLRVGDTASPIASTLVDDQGAAVDLTGAAVTFGLAPASGGELVVDDAVAEVLTPTDEGRVQYPPGDDPWPTAATDTAGVFLGRWRVTFDDGRVQRFPNEGYLVVLVTADVGAVDVDDLLELDPALEPERAARLLALARRAVAAHALPTVMAEPWSERVELVVMRHALRLARASAPSSSAGAVVSESIGSYTYRLDRPLALDDALVLGADLAAEIDAAIGRARAYSLDTTPDVIAWPVDWWQRDLDDSDLTLDELRARLP